MNVEKYYKKAYLDLPENKEEREIQIEKFKKVVEDIDKILNIDLSNEREYEITSAIKSPLREDEVKDSIDRELIFNNTNHREYGYFKLDNILED